MADYGTIYAATIGLVLTNTGYTPGMRAIPLSTAVKATAETPPRQVNYLLAGTDKFTPKRLINKSGVATPIQ